MPQKEELDLRFLERSLQRQDRAHQIFFRDLKIAAIALILFQFVIFFRFIEVNDEEMHFDAQLEQLRNDQTALNEVNAGLSSLAESLEDGQEQVTNLLGELPKSLRGRIVKLEEDIENLRQEPLVDEPPAISSVSPEIPEPPSIAIQAAPLPGDSNLPFGIVPSMEDFFTEGLSVAGFSETEIDILKTANPGENDFVDLVTRIVNKQIVPPLFENLARRKRESMENPFSEKKEQLLATLDRWRTALVRRNVNVSNIEQAVKKVERDLAAFQIVAPTFDRWWTTFGGKVAASGILEIDLDRSVDRFERQLGEPAKHLASVGQELSTLIVDAETEIRKLTTERADLENKLSQIESLLHSFAKPLPVLALGARDAVLYYPVILAVVFLVFVWRYVLLHQRARHLAETYRGRGFSDDALQLYFANLPGFGMVTGPRKSLAGVDLSALLFVVLCVVPGALGGVSLYWILTSISLRNSAPLFLHGVTVVVFVVAYAILAMHVVRLVKEQRS